jgi:hypothetical protein
LYNLPNAIKTAPQSPDLYVIENLRAKLGKELRNHSISSKKDLKKALGKAWERISPEYTKKKNW